VIRVPRPRNGAAGVFRFARNFLLLKEFSMTRWALFAALSLACGVAVTHAVPIYNAPVTPTKAGGDFIPGNGIPATGFAVDTDPATGVSVALKARSRDTGNPLSQSTNVYVVKSGLAADNINPWWNFDLQFSPGDDGTTADGFQLQFTVDFDPTPAYNYISFGGTVPIPASVPFVIENLGGGTWSSDDVDFVVADSSHLAFSTWTTFFGATYDPDATGEYTFSLTAKDQFGTQLAHTEIVVKVVPEPASLGLFALGGLLLVKRRRR